MIRGYPFEEGTLERISISAESPGNPQTFEAPKEATTPLMMLLRKLHAAAADGKELP